MRLENWVLSISKFKKATLKITDTLLTRVNLEPIEDKNGVAGVKTVWVGECGKSTLEVNAPSLEGNISVEGDTPPTIEYWHKGEKRGFAVQNLKNISCEFDQKTLEKLQTGKAAGIAIAAGAVVGLLGWLALIITNRITLVKQEAETSARQQIESDTSGADSHNEEGM